MGDIRAAVRDALIQSVDYCAETGAFSWNALSGLQGRKFGHAIKSGRLRVRFRGRHFGLSHLAIAKETGRWPTKEVLHINGDPADNRLSNLKEVPKARKLLNVLDNYIPVTESGCWIWLGNPTSSGYGKHRKMLAHRAVWIALHGPISPDTNICHKCDTRLCVNPDHLFPGSQLDNNIDRVMKCRTHKNALPPDKIVELSRSGLTARQAADRYGVDIDVARLILNGGRYWFLTGIDHEAYKAAKKAARSGGGG